jgi:hypothetical protein
MKKSEFLARDFFTMGKRRQEEVNLWRAKLKKEKSQKLA